MPARTPEPQTCRHVSAGMGAMFSGKTATPLQMQRAVHLRGGQHAQQQGLQLGMTLLEEHDGFKSATGAEAGISMAHSMGTMIAPKVLSQGCWPHKRVIASGWWHQKGSCLPSCICSAPQCLQPQEASPTQPC